MAIFFFKICNSFLDFGLRNFCLFFPTEFFVKFFKEFIILFPRIFDFSHVFTKFLRSWLFTTIFFLIIFNCFINLVLRDGTFLSCRLIKSCVSKHWSKEIFRLFDVLLLDLGILFKLRVCWLSTFIFFFEFSNPIRFFSTWSIPCLMPFFILGLLFWCHFSRTFLF